jgi:hypothetical protein
MSRTVIAAVVAVVIAALAAAAYLRTSSSLDDKVARDAGALVQRAYDSSKQLTLLEAIDVENKVATLAANPNFYKALQPDVDDAKRAGLAMEGFVAFSGTRKPNEDQPDSIALCNSNGDVVAMYSKGQAVPNVTKLWKSDKGEVIMPALDIVRANRVTISDTWFHERQLFRVGVAPVLDVSSLGGPNDASVPVIGAVVIAYAKTATRSQSDKRLLGAEVVYYANGSEVASSSFVKDVGAAEEDTERANAVAEVLKGKQVKEGDLGKDDAVPVVVLDGTKYYARALPLPRQVDHADRIPKGAQPDKTMGAMMVLAPVALDAESASAFAWIKRLIVLVGVGALVIALLGLYLLHRHLVAQVDQVELGVTDIISGNLDRTFRPVGPELDGLANGLNVMLARLLGRPEPGEEEFDEEGNPIVPGRVEFEEEEAGAAPSIVGSADPELAALAQESEPDYYKRVFTEYVAARKAVGSPDDVSFENFIAKLKVNEGKLKAQLQCRAVRFRVVTKDNKVTLKPVPIFA